MTSGQGQLLLFQFPVHLVRKLLIEVCIERCNVMMHGIVRQKLIGVRKEVALTLHKAVGGIVRDILPEGVLAEISGVGFFQKLLGSTQTGFLHFPGNGNGSGSLREGQPHRIRLGIRGQLCDQAIVGISACLQRKITVLQFSGGTLVPHIPAEQIGRTDHSSLLQLLCDGSNATALGDADGHLCTGLSSIAVDLVIRKHTCCTDCQYQQQQHDQQDLQHTAFFLFFWCFSAISTFLSVHHQAHVALRNIKRFSFKADEAILLPGSLAEEEVLGRAHRDDGALHDDLLLPGGFHQHLGSTVIFRHHLHKVKRILLAEINAIAVGTGNDGRAPGIQVPQNFPICSGGS